MFHVSLLGDTKSLCPSFYLKFLIYDLNRVTERNRHEVSDEVDQLRRDHADGRFLTPANHEGNPYFPGRVDPADTNRPLGALLGPIYKGCNVPLKIFS